MNISGEQAALRKIKTLEEEMETRLNEARRKAAAIIESAEAEAGEITRVAEERLKNIDNLQPSRNEGPASDETPNANIDSRFLDEPARALFELITGE